ncbi:hypothetical protein ACFQH6_19810 [Halobacteriaceae archaeon GCM10025711]
MNRRTYFKLAAGIGVGSISGCLSLDADSEAARANIGDAVDLLQECDKYLISKSEQFDSDTTKVVTFDEQYITSRVSQARRKLDVAADTASSSQMETVDALHEAVDVYEPAADVFAALATLINQMNNLDTDNLQSAQGLIRQMQTTYNPIPSQVDTTIKESNEVDGDLLAEKGIKWETTRAELEEADVIINDLGDSLDMLSALIDGVIAIEDGTDALRDENYAEADTDFSSAKASLEKSNDALARIESPEFFQSVSYEDLKCRILTLRDFSDDMAMGSRLATEDNMSEARRKFREAADTIDQSECY